MRAAADCAAVELAEKRTKDMPVSYRVDQPVRDRMLATAIAREAYMLGWEAGREDAGRGKAQIRSRNAVRPTEE